MLFDGDSLDIIYVVCILVEEVRILKIAVNKTDGKISYYDQYILQGYDVVSKNSRYNYAIFYGNMD